MYYNHLLRRKISLAFSIFSIDSIVLTTVLSVLIHMEEMLLSAKSYLVLSDLLVNISKMSETSQGVTKH